MPKCHFNKVALHYLNLNYLKINLKIWTESETAETLNDFFSNIVKNLNILRYSGLDCVAENITTNSQSYFEIQGSPTHTCNSKPMWSENFLMRLMLKTSKKKHSNWIKIKLFRSQIFFLNLSRYWEYICQLFMWEY